MIYKSFFRWLMVISIKLSCCHSFNYSFKTTFMGACGQHKSQKGGFYKQAIKVPPSTAEGENIALQQIFDKSYVVGEGVSMETATKMFDDQTIISSKINPYLTVLVKALSRNTHIAGPASLSSGIAKAAWRLTEAVQNREHLFRKSSRRHTMKFENELNRRDLRFLFLLWANCRKQLTSEDFRVCQQQAYGTLEASVGNYLPFYETIDARNGKLNQQLNEQEVAILELSLLSLRDYMVLNILMLKSMIETENDRFRIKYVDAYKKALERKSRFYLHYASKAIRAISRYYKKFHKTCSRDKIQCDKHDAFYKPGGKKKLKQDQTSSNKYFTSECSCVLVPQFAPHKCHMAITVVKDFVHDSSYGHRTMNTNDIDKAIREFASSQFEEKQISYKNDACKKVEEFWDRELLNTVKMAHKLAHDKFY